MLFRSDDTLAGSIGGPIYIPKVYNGRNRTFFFVAAEGYNNSVAASARFFVPNAQERRGDFSQSKGRNGAPLVIYDPLTTVRNADGTYTRTPFANNIIPADRLNQVGMLLPMKRALLTRLWWVSTTPFGKPVVPEVYWMLMESSNVSSSCRAARDSSEML